MHSSRMRTTRSSSSLLGGVYLSAMLGYTPWAWAWTPPRCGPGDPHGQSPQPPPLGVGLETPPGQTPNLPPGPGPRHPLPREQNS